MLVDEFQDTNARQRQIVYALSGFPEPDRFPQARNLSRSRLFVVGDAKQSIYRFRGADVTVFRQRPGRRGRRRRPPDRPGPHLSRPRAAGRGHSTPCWPRSWATRTTPERPYQVPFAPLHAFRESRVPAFARPFVELHLGLGENAERGPPGRCPGAGPPSARTARAGGIAWGDVALLFRASTGFPPYEDALERAGIPFVTVAGRGFYERPEVRDLLNALAALADPSDDLALAGLLRSPAVGLTDAALYRLRFGARRRERRSLWAALQDAPLESATPPTRSGPPLPRRSGRRPGTAGRPRAGGRAPQAVAGR